MYGCLVITPQPVKLYIIIKNQKTSSPSEANLFFLQLKLDKTLHAVHCHACSCFVLESCTPPLKLKGHIVVDVYLLTMSLFLWLQSLNPIQPGFPPEIVVYSCVPLMFRNNSH